ncbi:hypothetical protein C8D87_102459 [Lentzea atacamensis]|uniref:Uncharacterized protein n=1 Tax=Lentzea atacamensis TaxID=531938 RepID=A0ABX9EGT1_9PSEU|nr:hypothetical protein [Lentzea atacamensis]RAS68394.1 hypothetical protein C8D87_102459 [Lentzea atacamensis]
MTTTPYHGALHPRRKCTTSTASTVLLAATAFVFTGWMLAQGHSPVVAVATTSAVLAVTTTVSRSRLFSARFGPLPPANPMVIWQGEER